MQATAILGTRTGNSKIWTYGFAATGFAAVLNAILLLIGKAANVAFLVPIPGDPGTLQALTPMWVIFVTVVSLAVGTVGTALLAPRIRNGLFKFQILAGVLTVLSFWSPLSLQDGGTTVWLSAMHLVAGIAFIIGLQRAKQSER